MIEYKTDIKPSAKQVAELYKNCGLPRPVHDLDRIQRMIENSNLVVTAWDESRLVGISRSITDWSWSTYLADLAVHEDYKRSGIGKKLVDITREKAGEESMVLLLSVPSAMDYYPKIGFEKQNSAFIWNRKV